MSLRVRARVAARGLDVAFEVATGEVVAVLGPNGAGKSTILSVLAGTLAPDSGTVTLDDRVLTNVAAEQHTSGRGARVWVPPHDRSVALLAQDPLLFPHLSVLDNVAFGPRSQGMRRTPAHEVARRWLEEVDAARFADRRPSELSGGQAQRVAIARALATSPRVLALDEPMAALDVAVAPALRQVLRRVLHDQTAIIVTHDILDALLLADRILVVEDGHVVEDGPATTVLARPRSAFAARIAGLNLVRGTWDGQALVAAPGDQPVVDARGSGRATGALRIEGMVAEGDLVVGQAAVAVFRPSAVAVFANDPHGSPRNAIPVAVTEVEPREALIRIRSGDLSADITAQSAATLDLVPGQAAVFAVKATEVAVYPA